MENIEEYYINTISLNKKKQFRITRKSLAHLYDSATALNKIPLLQIIMDDEYQLNVIIDKGMYTGRMDDKHKKKSILIDMVLLSELRDIYKTPEMYEMLEDDTFTWNLTMKLEQRRRTI